MPQPYWKRFLFCSLSLALYGFGAFLGVKAGSAGTNAWSTLALGVSAMSGASFGSATLLISLVIIGIDLLGQGKLGFVNRKLATLAVDAIINMIYLGKNDDEILEICSTRLAKLELYPLPKLPISAKYNIFRILSNSKRGMKIIRRKTLRNSSPKK